MKKVTLFNQERFTKDIKTARNNLGLSLRQVGKEIGMTYVSIHKIERSERHPSIQTILSLVNYYQLDIIDYFDKENLLELSIGESANAEKTSSNTSSPSNFNRRPCSRIE